MESWVTKVLCLTLLFVLTMVFGLLPIQFIKCLRKRQEDNRAYRRYRIEFFLSLLNCLAGGVFLGTTLLHLIPETREEWEAILEEYNVETQFAVPEFIIGLGFFIIMLVENLVMVLQHHQHGKTRFDSVESSVCCDSDPHKEQLLDKEDIEGSHSSTYGSVGKTKSLENHQGNLKLGSQAQGASTPLLAGAIKHLTDSHGHSSHHHGHHHHHTHHPVVEVSPGHHHDDHGVGDHHHQHADGCGSAHPPVVVEKGDCVHIIHPNHHQHHHMEVEQLASLRSFLLLLALSLHTVFEGLAIGLQPDNQAVWNLFIAIVVHKSIIAFSMGIQFAEALKSLCRATTFIVLFAVMSPLGVAIGTLVFEIQGSGDASGIASGVLQAIAAGTFLYVTFFEVLHKEVGMDHSLLKVLFIILGYGAMVLLNLFNAEPKS